MKKGIVIGTVFGIGMGIVCSYSMCERHFRQEKDMVMVHNRYNWFVSIERDLKHYKHRSLKELKKFLIKDIAKIINDYVIEV